MVLDLGSSSKQQGMLCPHCDVALVMSAREGIEIDFCPKCRGVWLDRGELDKIIERSVVERAPFETSSKRHDDDDDDDDYKKNRRKKRRKSWIAEIFDELT